MAATQLPADAGVQRLNESPIGADPGYRPGYIGQTVLDETSGAYYVALGQTENDWAGVGGSRFIQADEPPDDSVRPGDVVFFMAPGSFILSCKYRNANGNLYVNTVQDWS